MTNSTEQLQDDLTESIIFLENLRKRLDYDDPEIRAYAVSVSIAIRDVLSSIYSAEMDIRFNKERACRF